MDDVSLRNSSFSSVSNNGCKIGFAWTYNTPKSSYIHFGESSPYLGDAQAAYLEEEEEFDVEPVREESHGRMGWELSEAEVIFLRIELGNGDTK